MKQLIIILVLAASFAVSCTKPLEYDYVLQNAIIYDGSGAEGQALDVGIKGDEIVYLGTIKNVDEAEVIDLSGLILSPGFIDIHTHLDPILELNNCESHLRQGVTTALGGPDGGGEWPLAPYLDTLEAIGIGMNVGFLVGHNVVRSNVMELDNRAPTPAELDSMKAQIAQGMEEGAFGISTGLKYLPGTFAELDEVVELSKVAARYGGFYTSHLREEGLGLMEGVGEAVVIAERADIPVVLTHHKVVGKPMWGSSKKTLALVDSARSVGLDVRIDQYPYTASHTGIGILIPTWARAGGNGRFRERIQDPVLRDSIKQQILFNIINDRGGADLKRVQFSRVRWQPELEGKTLHDWAIEEGLEPTLENGAELVIQAQYRGGANCIFHAMSQEDVNRIMQHPYTAIASDGRLNALGDGHPHPRAYGTFVRVLDKYVKQDSVLSLAEAIRKMTSLPAERMGLSDRGQIKVGYRADLTIFDPQTIREVATFTDPHHYPEGIVHVLVNGQWAIRDGALLNGTAGKVLRGPGYSEE
jgi:dihydroorotase/N-acyl-D-amino-acid deacylase